MRKVSGALTAHMSVGRALNTAPAPCCGYVFGATDRMPLRALSYVMAALNIRDNHFPLASLQVVHPLAAAEAINGVNRTRASTAARQLEIMSMGLGSFLTDVPVLEFYEAQDVPDASLTKEVAAVIRANPKLNTHFEAKAARGTQNYAAYVAAHVLVQDTRAELERLYDGKPLETLPQRIISIGAQSEHPFYKARMACRLAGILPDNAVAATGQIFTKHELPPYLSCRQGEPAIFDFEAALTQQTITHPVASVERDLRFLHERVGPSRKDTL